MSELCKNNESLETYFKGLIATLLDLECTSNGIGSLLAEAVFLVFVLTGEKKDVYKTWTGVHGPPWWSMDPGPCFVYVQKRTPEKEPLLAGNEIVGGTYLKISKYKDQQKRVKNI